MCGIVGLIASDLASAARAEMVERMATTIRHRGPDSSGVWSADERESRPATPVTFGHRRLAIVDLTPSGHQPMISPSGRFVITFNGEIYNYKEILEELHTTGFKMRGTSDTEVILGAFEAWGISSALARFVGMFAIGVVDLTTNVLTLIRDRFGEKPLYYGVVNGRFVFASELRPFKAPSAGLLNISHDSLGLLLRYNCIPAPHSIFKEVRKLLPGHMLEIPVAMRFDGIENCPASKPFYDVISVAREKVKNRFTGTLQDGVDELERLLRRSVSQQMVADVSVGAFLSGGIDSSSVVSMMQAVSAQPVQTFSIGFSDGAYNEAPYAAAIAKHLGTAHTELTVTARDALTVVPKLANFFDEPFADSSQIPTFLVAQLARQNVTVSLSGDGGDELFGGYERYRWTSRIWNNIRFLPLALRRAMGAALATLPSSLLNHGAHALQSLAPSLSGFRNPADKALRLATVLGSPDVKELYHSLLCHWDDIAVVVPGAEVNPSFRFHEISSIPGEASAKEWMMLYDLMTYLPDDILCKVDRASMAVSLESRVPLLDHRIVEFAMSLPENFRFRAGETKWILREVLKRYVPVRSFDRPKRGFSIPLDSWLGGPLREWARDLLDPLAMEQLGYINPIAVQAAWEEHMSGARPRHNQLWIVLMFCAWQREFFKG